VITLLLNRAVLLKCVYEIDKDVAGKVIESTLEEKRVVEHLVQSIHSTLQEKNVPQPEWKDFIKAIFNKYDYNQSGNVDEDEFRQFLGDLKIFMKHESFKLVWNRIDFDLSGEVTWDEVYVLLFPENKEMFKLELEVVEDLRIALMSHLSEMGDTSEEARVTHLKKIFDSFDDDKSGHIGRKEFKEIFKMVGLGVSERVFKLVFAAIDTDNSGQISWDEFHFFAFGRNPGEV
jgi:Ca2+-binding EF-hand superfamily protein